MAPTHPTRISYYWSNFVECMTDIKVMSVVGAAALSGVIGVLCGLGAGLFALFIGSISNFED